jgi:2-keto-4-pentenoate hydratase/2-oxohepta-3-ene-1,7-dioic acid hydratase in catechol pathway
MKIARYSIQDSISYGVIEEDVVKEIAGPPFEKIELTGQDHALSQVKLLAPVMPSKMLALALNYRSHLGDSKPPDRPEPFYKTPTCVVGPDEPIIIPKQAGRVDEEAELAVVMGRRCSGVSEAQALDYVLGYTCGNDVSARVWQRGDMQWWRAKSSDTFGPIGPVIATDIDGSNLNIWARVNGKEVQHCHTSELLFGIPTLISFISQVVTLEPGDIIFTGTSGVPAEITPGDVVGVEIEGIGTLTNPVKSV